ncbi:hypothetical protein MJH12_17810, partial [bacterium]|nr:hypothetical protein [bacterium]
MKLKNTFVLSSSILALLTLCGCGLESTSTNISQPLASKSISGIIARGKAVNGKKVSLLDANLNELSSTITDILGHYQIKLPQTDQDFYVKSEDLMSFIADDSNGSNLVVHVNPITTFATTEILKLPIIQRNAASFTTKGQELVTKVLGNSTTFEAFSKDQSFSAASTQDNQQASIADMILDGLQDKADTKKLSQLELIQVWKQSTDSCEHTALLNDDVFGTSLLENIARNKLNNSDIQKTISSNQVNSISYNSDNAIVSIFTEFSDTFSNANHNISKEIAVKAFKKSVFKVIDDEIANQGVCTLADLHPDSLKNLISNLKVILSDNIRKMAARLDQLTLADDSKDLVFVNAILQSSNIASQLNISQELSSQSLQIAEALSQDIMNHTESVLVQEINLSPDKIEDAFNSEAVQQLASFAQRKRTELAQNTLLGNSVKTLVPQTHELVQIDNNALTETPLISRPINSAQAIDLSFSKVNQRKVSGIIKVTRASSEADFNAYHLYWGVSPIERLPDASVITKISKLNPILDFHLSDRLIPINAKYILVYTAQDELESRISTFVKI